jgi:hypothetical protein
MRDKISNFKFRSSALGNIITKSGKLTDGAKTYINDCFIGLIYNVKKEAYGKALDKGIATEEDVIKLINDSIYKGQLLIKVKEGAKNEWIMGTPDIIKDNIVYDCKSAWDLYTFGKADLTWIYEWQLKAYMFLYDLPKARLFYGIVNMPPQMIYSEQMSHFYRNPGKWVSMESPDYLDWCEEFEKANKYDHLPIEQRFKVWDINRSEEDDQRIIDSVKMARSYMGELYEKHLENIEKNIKLISS